MDFNLNWVYYGISWILLRWHDLWGAVLGQSSGLAWVLAIVFLVITVRAVLFPVFVKQIKSQRAMQAISPQMKELRDKYKDDQQTLQKEMMELYRREKANPLMGCLPIFLQIPVFIGLFHVLRLINPNSEAAYNAMTQEYGWSAAQFESAANARLFGAPLAASFRSTSEQLQALDASRLNVQIVAGFLVLIMVATTYITQRQMIARNGPAPDNTQAMVQKLMLYGIPASLLVSGLLFPIGVVIYWVTTNLFSMGQQFWVLRRMPPLGAAQKSTTDPVVAKALAPKPGVKPVNPKKGGRPAAQSGATKAAPAPGKATPGKAAGKATPTKATAPAKAGQAAKGTPAKGTPAKSAGASARSAGTAAKAAGSAGKSAGADGKSAGADGKSAGADGKVSGSAAGTADSTKAPDANGRAPDAAANGRGRAPDDAEPAPTGDGSAGAGETSGTANGETAKSAASPSGGGGGRRPQDNRSRRRRGGRR